jgi:hypothetical protein
MLRGLLRGPLRGYRVGTACVARFPRNARGLTTMFRRDFADMHGLRRIRRVLTFVHDTTPTFADGRPFRLTTRFDCRWRRTRNGRRDVCARTRGSGLARLVSRAKRSPDIQPQQTEYRDSAEPDNEVISRKFR